MKQLTLTAVPDFPEVVPGDDLAALLIDALERSGLRPAPGDILAIAQKVVSKAENRFARLDFVVPGEQARAVAVKTEKDPRLVELILRESQEISRMRPGVLIVRHRLGFVCANAGIDRSNVPQPSPEAETVLLLPADPDRSARQIRARLEAHFGAAVGVVITDSHGRPHRMGTEGVAIGVAGFAPLWDRRGEADREGYRLQHTEVGVAVEIAAAAGLLMGQAGEGTPIVLLRGLALPAADRPIQDLIRPEALDLYR